MTSTANGWVRVDLADGRWVAVVPDESGTAFGGTVWRRAGDGNWYADGVTAGHPVASAAAPTPELAAAAIAALVDAENGVGR
jgi:hypothetical protein